MVDAPSKLLEFESAAVPANDVQLAIEPHESVAAAHADVGYVATAAPAES